MQAGVNLDNLTTNYIKSKSKHNENLTMGDKYWKDLKYDYTINYKKQNKYHLNKNFGKEYVMQNDEETIIDAPYWEKKETDEYYSKSRLERVKLALKDKLNSMVRFIKDFYLIILSFICIIIKSAYDDVKQILIV